VTAGTIATYIPELAKADPEAFGVAVATVDGKVYTAAPIRTSSPPSSAT
jgi:glutaminase